jgi:hypothetical protein
LHYIIFVYASIIARWKLAFETLSNTIVTNLRNIFAIGPKQDVPSYFIGIAAV